MSLMRCIWGLMASAAFVGMVATPAAAASLDRGNVLQELEGLLNSEYFDLPTANSTAKALAAATPSLATIQDRTAFAAAVTRVLYSVSHDRHLKLLASPDGLPEMAATPEIAQQREIARNYGVASVAILPGNIGCLTMTGFARFTPDTAKRIEWAFNFLANTYGLVIDLTHSRGGDPATEALIVGYLTKPGIHLDSTIPRDGSDHPTITPDSYQGTVYGPDRPVAVAASRQTFSAAEALAYDLQTLHRARIYGEPTGGGGNAGHFATLSDGFIAFMPVARTVNAITHSSWEGVGVTPDVATAAEGAVDSARIHLIQQLLLTTTIPTMHDILQAGANDHAAK